MKQNVQQMQIFLFALIFISLPGLYRRIFCFGLRYFLFGSLQIDCIAICKFVYITSVAFNLPATVKMLDWTMVALQSKTHTYTVKQKKTIANLVLRTHFTIDIHNGCCWLNGTPFSFGSCCVHLNLMQINQKSTIYNNVIWVWRAAARERNRASILSIMPCNQSTPSSIKMDFEILARVNCVHIHYAKSRWNFNGINKNTKKKIQKKCATIFKWKRKYCVVAQWHTDSLHNINHTSGVSSIASCCSRCCSNSSSTWDPYSLCVKHLQTLLFDRLSALTYSNIDSAKRSIRIKSQNQSNCWLLFLIASRSRCRRHRRRRWSAILSNDINPLKITVIECYELATST